MRSATAKILMLVLSLSLPLSLLCSQEKYEKESRIKAGKLPERALEWFRDAYEGDPRVKWYLEESLEAYSFEAKLKWKGHRHSVEFDTTGRVEDIEIELELEELPGKVRENLSLFMANEYEKYNIRRIQRQYTGSPDDLEDVIDELEYEDIVIRYEIEYYARSGSEKELWEGLFDVEGNPIRQRKVIIKPTENLDF